MSSEPLDLNDTFRHFNSQIWQIPTWSIAIAVGVIVAANEIESKTPSPWGEDAVLVRTLVLVLGFLLLAALAAVLHRWRGYEAASAPFKLPVPPFKQRPQANCLLQGASCLIAGGVGGLALTHFFSKPLLLLAGFVIGAAGWVILERLHSKVVGQINEQRAKARKESSTGAAQQVVPADGPRPAGSARS